MYKNWGVFGCNSSTWIGHSAVICKLCVVLILHAHCPNYTCQYTWNELMNHLFEYIIMGCRPLYPIDSSGVEHTMYQLPPLCVCPLVSHFSTQFAIGGHRLNLYSRKPFCIGSKTHYFVQSWLLVCSCLHHLKKKLGRLIFAQQIIGHFFKKK